MSITKIYRRDNQPFAQIPNEAIRDPRITPGAFRLLAYLMSHQDGYEVTYDQIERQTGLGRFAINQGIGNLQGLGWLEVDRPKLPNGQFGPKSWTVLNPHTSTTVGNSTVESPHMGKPTDIKKNTVKEEQVKEELHAQNEFERDLWIDDVDKAFDLFWAEYPRKVGKGEAKRTYLKALSVKVKGRWVLREDWDIQAVDILVGATRLAHDPYKPAKEFIPYPATWLHREGWLDEPYPERELTAEEKQVLQEAAIARRREADRKWSETLRAEMEEAKRKAEANPPKRCEHDRIGVLCPQCRSKYLN